MATNSFLFKDKIGCRLTKASNVETLLLGYMYIAWQWDRYLVPQIVFLVITTINLNPACNYQLKGGPKMGTVLYSNRLFRQTLFRQMLFRLKFTSTDTSLYALHSHYSLGGDNVMCNEKRFCT